MNKPFYITLFKSPHCLFLNRNFTESPTSDNIYCDYELTKDEVSFLCLKYKISILRFSNANHIIVHDIISENGIITMLNELRPL